MQERKCGGAECHCYPAVFHGPQYIFKRQYSEERTTGYVTNVNAGLQGCQKDVFGPQYSLVAVVGDTAITKVPQVVH